MNTILQKRIEETARDIAELCPDCDFHCESPNPCIPKILYQKLVEIANFALQNQWISVEEALPKEDNDNDECSIVVLARGNKTYFVAYYDFHDNVWYSEEGCYRLYNITHWMEIPLEGGEK